MTEETHAGIDHLIGFVGLFAKVLRVLTQRPAQAFAFALAMTAPVDFTVGIDKAQARIPVDVTAVPPAVEGWQIVGAGGRQRVVRPVEDRLETGVVLLKQQHAHAENRTCAEFFSQPLGHRAQVFADHYCTCPVCFQKQNPHHGVVVVAHIGALGWASS